MNAQSLDLLEGRLARLEKELRLWRYGAVALAIGLIAAAASPIPRSDEIVAKRITIKGNQGQPLVTIGSWNQGQSGFMVVHTMPGAETVEGEFESDKRLRKELGDNWGAVLVGLPGGAAIELK